MGRRRTIFLFLLLFVLGSCSPPPKPKLTKEMKTRVDSLYMKSLDSLKKELDLACDKRYTRVYNRARDSFENMWKEEIENLTNQ